MLVGEVRRATTGSGVSWKLSGGSLFDAAVTKVSKKRQVRRAIRRRLMASGSDNDRRPGTGRERLAHRATAGDAIQAAANTAAMGQVPCPAIAAAAIAAMPINTPPAMRR